MTTNFDVIKLIDQRTKDIVNGFIKDVQSLLPNNKNTYYNIPSLVMMIITLYYYKPEYFTVHGNYIKLNEDKNVIQYMYKAMEDAKFIPSYQRHNTVYGNIIINRNSTGKYIWKFNIIEPNTEAIICIGIDSSNKQMKDDMFYKSYINKSTFYGYQCYGDEDDDEDGGFRMYNGSVDVNLDVKYTSQEDYGVIYSAEKNEITMELDMNKKTLKYYVNGMDQGILWNNINFKNDQQYAMCVSLDENMTLQLSDFQHKIK